MFLHRGMRSGGVLLLASPQPATAISPVVSYPCLLVVKAGSSTLSVGSLAGTDLRVESYRTFNHEI